MGMTEGGIRREFPLKQQPLPGSLGGESNVYRAMGLERPRLERLEDDDGLEDTEPAAKPDETQETKSVEDPPDYLRDVEERHDRATQYLRRASTSS